MMKKKEFHLVPIKTIKDYFRFFPIMGKKKELELFILGGEFNVRDNDDDFIIVGRSDIPLILLLLFPFIPVKLPCLYKWKIGFTWIVGTKDFHKVKALLYY